MPSGAGGFIYDMISRAKWNRALLPSQRPKLKGQKPKYTKKKYSDSELDWTILDRLEKSGKLKLVILLLSILLAIEILVIIILAVLD